jgi:hypothetical protein
MNSTAFRTKGNHADGGLGCWTWNDQYFIGGTTWGLVVLLVVHWLCQGGHRGGIQRLPDEPARAIRYVVDPQRATWPELALIPGIGETLARRISDVCRTQGGLTPQLIEDVPGIGDKKLAQTLGYVEFGSDQDNAVSESTVRR